MSFAFRTIKDAWRIEEGRTSASCTSSTCTTAT
jgi:hypothetical protein